MRAEAPAAAPVTEASPAATPEPGRWARAAAGAFSVALIMWALVLPLWEARLLAPQYPGGLRVTAYGDRVVGDLREINGLNHYVGMQPFAAENFPELHLGLWLPTIILAVAGAVVATLGGRRWWARLARLGMWSIPFGVLAVIQFRLYQFGHDLDPAAPLRLEPFTPWVIGPTKVWNFTTWSFPGWALLTLLAAAALLSFGPRIFQRAARALAPSAAGAAILVLLAPMASAQTDHHHHSPEEHAEYVAGEELGRRLAAAKPGVTVTVPAGVHRGSFLIEVPLVLRGAEGAVLDRGGTGTVLSVEASDVTVEGLTVRGSGPGPIGSPAGIEVLGDRVTINGVTVEDAYMGVLVRGVEGVRIVGSTIRGRAGEALADDGHAAGVDEEHDAHGASGRGDAISLQEVDGALVRDNRIHGARDGVFLLFGSDALVDRNTITGSRYAIHSMYARHLGVSENRFGENLSGIVLMYGGPALVLGNTVLDHRSPSTGFGLLLKEVAGLEAARNVLVRNRVGVQVEGPTGDPADVRIVLNTVALNEAGLGLFPSARATFAGNSFVGNTTEVLAFGRGVAGHNLWSDQATGNFWGSYRGFSRLPDDIGDVAHHEGGTVSGLLARAPMLAAFASSPGFRLLSTLEDRWIQADPVVTDEIPLLRPLSPPLEEGATRSPWAAAAGAAMVAGAVTVLVGERRRTATTPAEVQHATA